MCSRKMNLYKNKTCYWNLVFLFFVLLLELNGNMQTKATRHDWVDMTHSLTALEQTLSDYSRKEENLTRFTYDGSDVLAEMVLEKRNLMRTELWESEKLLRYLKNTLGKLADLNQTLSAPPKKTPIDGCSYPFLPSSVGCLWVHTLPHETYPDARRRCQALGSDLMIVPGPRLQELKKILHEVYGVNTRFEYLWVGATKVGDTWRQKSWRWNDSSELNLTHVDYYVPSEENRGACLALNDLKGLVAMPWKCNGTIGYICEKKMNL